MSTVEFVLWLAGAVDLVGDEPPTPAQWAQIRAKATEVVGKLAADKLLERAAKVEQEQMYTAPFAEYKARVEGYWAQLAQAAVKPADWNDLLIKAHAK